MGLHVVFLKSSKCIGVFVKNTVIELPGIICVVEEIR